MVQERTVSSMGMRMFFQVLLSAGESLPEIEQSTGIIWSELENPKYRAPISSLKSLVEYCYRVTGDPSLCLTIGKNFNKSNINYTTVLLMNCATLLDACVLFSRYIKLLSEIIEVELTEEGENFEISLTNISDYQADWIMEFYLANFIYFVRETAAGDIKPVRVEFQHRAPAYSAKYENVFRTPVLFEQENNLLVVQKDDMNRKIPNANAKLRRVLEERVKAIFDEQTQPKMLRDQVRTIIQKHIAEPGFDIDFAAAKLGMHRTTLYRKLNREGTSYTALLEEVRKHLAIKYIQQRQSNFQIAHRLGYSEPSAFQQAFKRWFGRSPGEFRSDSKGKAVIDDWRYTPPDKVLGL